MPRKLWASRRDGSESSAKSAFGALPVPSLVRVRDGGIQVYGGKTPDKLHRIVDPITRQARDLSLDELYGAVEPQALLVTRKLGGPGITPSAFSFRWFLPSIWRYRKPLAHVLVASFFVQTFALVTPLFFQVIIDKVLSHKGYDTLFVLVGGLAVIGLFDVVLQYLRTYALAHDQPYRCGAWAPPLRPPLSSAHELFRDARRGPDGRARAGA